MDLNAEVQEVILTDTNGREHVLATKTPNVATEAQIDYINIYESIEYTSILAEMKIIDTAINLISTAPIVGTELVTMKLKTFGASEKVYTYTFVVYGIRNRGVSMNYQEYVLDMFSPEALLNETIRVGKSFADFGDQITSQIINEYLDTNKNIDTEPCKFKTKIIPSLKRPFTIISELAPECVSTNFNPEPLPISSKTNPGSGSSKNGDTSAVKAETADAVISGSAGYFFYETYDGYVFKSIDKILQNPVKHNEYIYGMVQDDNNTSNTYVILDYQFTTQENILNKMRHGVYSSMISFFNPSTLEYEEYFFDLSKEYPNMIHLGTEESIPDKIKELSKYPSRVMLQFYDHEKYYNGTSIADPNAGQGGTQYPDYRKQWMAQSISRNVLLNNQTLNILVPCNLDLRAGDKLKIKLPNQSVQSLRSGGNSVDQKNSGTYLIKTISYEIKRDAKGLVAVSNLTLIRDNLGS